MKGSMRETCSGCQQLSTKWVSCLQTGDSFHAEVKLAHQMHHKDDNNGSAHMSTDQ